MACSPRISVIIPICNVEKFLDECLDSVSGQTFRDIEIICLNDGSKDGSSAIMHRHAAADERIVCIDKQNEGYGATCNRGLDMARGEYIAIVEPDDYLRLDMFKDMLALVDALGGAIDVVKTPWLELHEWDNPSTLYTKPGGLYRALPTSKAPFVLADAPILLEGHPSIWSALYRRAFLDEQGIRFHPYPGAGWADNPFLVQTLCRARKIAYLDKMFYCYRTDLPGSTLHHATEEKVALPFVRWMDMTSEMHDMGVRDEGIWLAHTVRAFNYLDGAIIDDGWDNPVVRRMTKRMFDMIPEQHVLHCGKLSPAKKRFYFEQRGLPVPNISPLPYAKHLAVQSVHALRAMGVAYLVRRTAQFVGEKVKGIGVESAARG